MIAAVLALTAAMAAADPDPVARARELYNMRDFDGAIAAAEAARKSKAPMDAVNLILARARLERFRESQDILDLAAGRGLLAQVEPGRLSPRDRVEWLIGLGESLYLDNQFGAAAEMFDQALGGATVLETETKERLLDWWATALDARARNTPAREMTYTRILRRMEDELRDDAHTATASYWQVVALRGIGDLERAWDAAMSAWVRAPMAGSRGVTLRADLDLFVNQVLIPERTKRFAGEEAQRQAAALRADWESLKQRWRANDQ